MSPVDSGRIEAVAKWEMAKIGVRLYYMWKKKRKNCQSERATVLESFSSGVAMSVERKNTIPTKIRSITFKKNLQCPSFEPVYR